MSIKLGTTNIVLPYSKAYLGSNLVYQKSSGGYEDIEFTECPFPTSWTEVTKGTEYTATNDYGEWRIWADEYYSSYTLNKGFDGNDNTKYMTTGGKTTSILYLGIDLPEGIRIKPTKIYSYIEYEDNDEANVVNGLNESEEWETVCSFGKDGKKTTQTVETEKFYSKFKLAIGHEYTSKQAVYEFQIISGIIRKIK